MFEYDTPARMSLGNTGDGGHVFPWGSALNPFLGVRALYVNNSFARGVIPPSDWNKLVEDSYANLLPGIRPRISALNSIYELKDIKSVPHTLRNIKSALLSLRSIKTAAQAYATAKKLSLTSVMSKPLRTILKAVGDVYLQKEFNVEPLLSDLNSVRVTYLNIRKKINNLLADEGKPKRHHYRGRLGEYTDNVQSVDVSFNDFQVTGTRQWINVLTYTKALFHAELEYSFVLKDFERAEALPRGALDQLGINVDPGVIWRAIPWSFVIDWFVGVSRFLSQFAMRNIEPVTYISRYCASATVERVSTTSVGLTTSFPISFAAAPLCTVFESAYVRQVATPGINAPRVQDLNSHEFWLSGALAITR